MSFDKKESIGRETPLDKIIKFSLENPLIIFLMMILIMAWGILVAPFDWRISGIDRDPVPVDAIPDMGENQQIVFTRWNGRSPQDMEDQVTYPLTVALMGVPGVKTIRSFSMLGISSVYVIFDEDVDFYWSRSRILEKLNSLPAKSLPEGVKPALGPDATALGQVFWYTLEGRDEKGQPTGGWDLAELRSIQDWYVRNGLLATEGISEVASVGGHVQEYQIDVDPAAMRIYRVGLEDIVKAVKNSNLDVGAKTIEINRAEYIVRGIGFVKSIKDLENSVIKVNDNVPVYLKNVSHISLGPALRLGVLDKEGAEVVGGVAVVRFGENPMAAIQRLKKKIDEISPGLPKKTLEDGSVSQVKIIPFYDRTVLIEETLDTLYSALSEEMLVTIIVILVMVGRLSSSLLISGLLPLSVLMCFIAMKSFDVDANIVALSGIAIAIGTMVDMAIVLSDNILRHLNAAHTEENKTQVVYRACREVSGAVVTAVATTLIGFLPVFTLEAAEGKLFKPLAYTKSFALIASILVAMLLIPPCARFLFTTGGEGKKLKRIFGSFLIFTGFSLLTFQYLYVGTALITVGFAMIIMDQLSKRLGSNIQLLCNVVIIILVGVLLANHWEPLGSEKWWGENLLFIFFLFGSTLGALKLFLNHYSTILGYCLKNKALFLSIPLFFILLAGMIWQGADALFSWMPQSLKTSVFYSSLQQRFPGLGKEFMPTLDEGSFLFMPTTMPHASIGEARDVLGKQDMALKNIPEIELAVGKLGRAETPLDPAPVSMIETIINYHHEYLRDEQGKRLSFKFDPDEVDFFRDKAGKPVPANDGRPYRVQGRFNRDDQGNLIPSKGGQPFRLWRQPLDPELNSGREAWSGIRDENDIWAEIVKACEITGTTSAPKLQPIAARLVMLQSGMRAPMGVKIKGSKLHDIEKAGVEIEKYLKEIPSIEKASVFADRVVGKPYLEIHINREEIARFGIPIAKVQKVIEVAIGGMTLTHTIEGRERYPVRVRYMRELRDNMDGLGDILVSGLGGAQIPLKQLAEIKTVRGPQMIKSEDTFLVSYVIFDKKTGFSEVDVVKATREYLRKKEKSGELKLPEEVSYTFTGSFENQVRSENKLKVVLPLALCLIFLVLYFHFKSTITTFLVFSGILVAWSGGFIMIWLYGLDGFLDFHIFDTHIRELFQVKAYNLSVAVWVGFLALFGIASDDGVILGTYLKSSFEKNKPTSIEAIHQATIEAAKRRIRPCLMTTATTLLALIPVLTSKGRGADVMVPMAIPSFGGMLMVILTVFTVPVLYSLVEEIKLKQEKGQ